MLTSAQDITFMNLSRNTAINRGAVLYAIIKTRIT